jgi:hypothetical protein
VLARIAKLYAIEADIRGQPPDVRQSDHQLHTLLPWNWQQPSTISAT